MKFELGPASSIVTAIATAQIIATEACTFILMFIYGYRWQKPKDLPHSNCTVFQHRLSRRLYFIYCWE